MNEFDLNTVPVKEMLEKLSVSRAFGEPIHEGETTVIPVASVTYGFGLGSGYGRQSKPDEPSKAAPTGETGAPDGEGGGGGGGAGGIAKPLGFIRIDAEGARYEPFLDPTRISIAGIFLSAWSVFWIAATIRAFARKGA